MKSNTGIPNFQIVGPKKDGLLDQFVTVGWKWKALGTLYGMAYQLMGDTCDEMNKYIDEFRQFGRKWHRRAVVSKNHHLWAKIWRLGGEISKRDNEIQGMRDNWKPIPYRLGWFRRLCWRVVFGSAYEKPFRWEDYD